MKYITFIFVALIMIGVAVPSEHAFARRGGDDDHRGHERGSDDRGSDDSWMRLASSSMMKTGTSSPIEAEADVYTDTTIVKVEMQHGRKVVFTTTADTRDEVLDAIVSRLGLVRGEVDAVLDFEVEDRASRAKERAKITGVSNVGGNSSSTNSANDSDIRARIKVLEDLLQRLIALLKAQ